MTTKKNRVKALQNDLDAIVSAGITADKAHLKKDMCAQFADYREWIREYVVNSMDAGAKKCQISGFEKNNLITVTVSDDGHGMTKNGIIDFFTLYRSNKEKTNSTSVGRHGIGKLSAAAIPGQVGFELVTSTGTESWKASAGSLLSDEPIIISRIYQKEMKKGTVFNITFKKKVPLHEEMIALEKVLKRYVSFRSMIIEIEIPSDPYNDYLKTTHLSSINEPWPGDEVTFYKSYQIEYRKIKLEIVTGLGATTHSIFQHKIFITDKYNLIDPTGIIVEKVPGLTIMVDSPDFELPFGRHKLSNEEILVSINKILLNEILPDFYMEIFHLYVKGELRDYHFSNYHFDLLTSALLRADYDPVKPWFSAPVLKCVNHKLASFMEVESVVSSGKKIYLTDKSQSGIDFSVFDGIVLENEQPGHCSEIINRYFKNNVIDLGKDAVVMEKPGTNRSNLTETELLFENYLGFHPEVFNAYERNIDNSDHSFQGISHSNSSKPDNDPTTKELDDANTELKNIRWRVSRLVEYDGVTPCRTHLFLYEKQTIILNLNHPSVADLIQLSKTCPELAGHWAMAMVLSDKSNVMKHLTAETREDLLVLDALSKVTIEKKSTNYMNIMDGIDKNLIRFRQSDLN
jgi:hypothetical protein